MRKIGSLFVFVHLAIQGICDNFWAFFYKKRFGSCGCDVMIKPCTSNFKGFENIYFGNHIRMARYATIYATNAKVIIGNHIDAAPHLSIMSGNHSTDELGRFMYNLTVHEKKENEDKDVILEDDLWIGINVTILSGVTVGRGSAIGAGSIVNKTIPPYSIVAGIPAKVLKFRFSVEQILEHEKKLYAPEMRFSKEALEAFRKNNEKQ